MSGCGLVSSGSGQEPVAGSYQHNNEPLGFIIRVEILDALSDSQIFRIRFYGFTSIYKSPPLPDVYLH
jgi:hypothetical protein